MIVNNPFGLRILYDLFAFKIIMLPVLNDSSLINRISDHIPYAGGANHFSISITVSLLVKNFRTAMRTISISREFENCPNHFCFLLVNDDFFIRKLLQTIDPIGKRKAFSLFLSVSMGIVYFLA